MSDDKATRAQEKEGEKKEKQRKQREKNRKDLRFLRFFWVPPDNKSAKQACTDSMIYHGKGYASAVPGTHS